MLTKTERQNLNTEFYTALGMMMQGSYSEMHKKTRWTNYRTNVKDIYVRLDADNKGASFSIDFQQKDAEVRAIFWEQLTELKLLLQSEFEDELIWHESFFKPDGSEISRVELSIGGGSLYEKNTWPILLPFLKECLLAFDRFWTNSFDIFKALED